jgi:hypothetical protein
MKTKPIGHRTIQKFLRRWKGLFVVKSVYPNATYLLQEFAGVVWAIRQARKYVELFKR